LSSFFDNSGDKFVAGVSDICKVLKLYLLPDELRLDMDALVQVRNQIVHPSQVPFGAAEWPDSIKWLRDRRVLDGKMPQSGTEALCAARESQAVRVGGREMCREARYRSQLRSAILYLLRLRAEFVARTDPAMNARHSCCQAGRSRLTPA
jgi:hypothetical protein